ncbi:MAG: type II secretion system F family protein [Planctomycetota bacterium]
MLKQHQARANLYRRLAVSQSAGIPLAQAVSRQRDGLLDPVGRQIDQGATAGEAFAAMPGISQVEARAIEAGDRAGSLPDVFNRLADRHEEQLKNVRSLIVALAYPVLLLHAAFVLPALPELIKSGLGGFLEAALVPLVTCYAAAIGVWVAVRLASKVPALEPIELAIPLWGSYVSCREWAEGFRVCGMLYTHGGGLVDAVHAASTTAGRETFAQAWREIEQRLRQGESLAQACSSVQVFPTDALDMLQSGEASGQLDTVFGQLERDYEGRRSMRLKALIGVAAGAAFLVAACLVAYRVISFYVGHVNQALDVLNPR